MPINTVNKSLKLNKSSMFENFSSWIEQDIIVPDTKPDAMKIINVTVTPYVNNIEVMQDKVKVSGNINYFIIYKVDDERFNTRGLFTTIPYTEHINIKNVDKDSNISVVPTCKNVIYSLPNERKISVKAEISFKTQLKKIETVELINRFEDAEDIECKMCNNTFFNIKECKKNIIASKEDFMLPKEAEDFFEILHVDAKIKDTEYKESYNKIMVKGDIDIKMMYLAENNEEMIKMVNTTIPFSAMVELENISDRSNFKIDYIIQNFNLRPNQEITSTKTMTADYEIEVEVVMYEEEDIEYVEDFYSQTRQLEFNSINIEAVKKDMSFKKTVDIRETVSNILSPDTRLIDYSLDTNYVLPQSNQNNIILEGNAKITLLIEDVTTFELDSKTIDILINETISIENLNSESNSNIDILAENLNITQNGQDLDIKLQLSVNANVEDVTTLSVIDKITDEKLDVSNLDSINIYIVKPGDTLWSIAKKYKTSVDKIVATNEIENPSKIDVGQKILIIR